MSKFKEGGGDYKLDFFKKNYLGKTPNFSHERNYWSSLFQ